MGNSLHSDNPICPVNVIAPDPKFFNSIPKSPNPMPLPFEKHSRLIFRSSLRSSNRKSQSKRRFRKSMDAVGKVLTKGYEISHLTIWVKTDCLNP